MCMHVLCGDVYGVQLHHRPTIEGMMYVSIYLLFLQHMMPYHL
jgi:hypothetical protein